MPHQCIACDRTFADGSKAMLSGCPGCGGNKFQFLPHGSKSIDDADGDHGVDASKPVEPPESRPAAPPEDAAQASARRAVVTPDELPTIDERAAIFEDIAADARPADAPPADPPDLETLRQELDEQFESIKIVEPGEYELNLMELYDRQEYIIALEEDGRYVIEVPTHLEDREPGD